TITVGANTLTGFTDSGGFCGAGNRYRLHFYIEFDRPFATAGVAGANGAVDTSKRTIDGSSAGTVPPAAKTASAQSGVDNRRSPAPESTLPGANDVQPLAAAAFVSFNTSTNRSVTARVGISFVSIDNARANL